MQQLFVEPEENFAHRTVRERSICDKCSMFAIKRPSSRPTSYESV